MNLQRASDAIPAPAPLMPCHGLRCPVRRQCGHYAANDFASVWSVRPDHCRDRDGNLMRFIEVAPVRPLSEPDTEWSDL